MHLHVYSFASISGWSVASPVPQPQGFEISEEEGHFTVSYMAKQLERTTGMHVNLQRFELLVDVSLHCYQLSAKQCFENEGEIRSLFLEFERLCNICFIECISPIPRMSRNEKRISSALDLARKITMYNNRYKTAGIIAQETEPQLSPSLRPRTPVQPYPYFPWQPKGDCLSSTKV